MAVIIGNQMQVKKSVHFQRAKKKIFFCIGIGVAFSRQELVYQLLEQNIITRIFKNIRSFVHQKAAQRDVGEWDIS